MKQYTLLSRCLSVCLSVWAFREIFERNFSEREETGEGYRRTKGNIQIRMLFPFERVVKSMLIESVASDRKKPIFHLSMTSCVQKKNNKRNSFLPSDALVEVTWTFVIVSAQSSWSQSARERERASLNRAALVVRLTTKEKKQPLHKHLPSSSSFSSRTIRRVNKSSFIDSWTTFASLSLDVLRHELESHSSSSSRRYSSRRKKKSTSDHQLSPGDEGWERRGHRPIEWRWQRFKPHSNRDDEQIELLHLFVLHNLFVYIDVTIDSSNLTVSSSWSSLRSKFHCPVFD